MPDKTPAQKARVRPGAKIAVLNEEPGVVETLGLEGDVSTVAPADADIVLLFVRTRDELQSQMPAAVMSLSPESTIWVFFRKCSKAAGLDVNRDDIWGAAEPMGLRPLGILSVDATWSVFRLRRKPSVT